MIPQEPGKPPVWPAIRYTPVGGTITPDACGGGTAFTDDQRVQVDCIVEAINNDEELNQQVWDALAASYGGDQSKAAALKETIAKTATSCVVG